MSKAWGVLVLTLMIGAICIDAQEEPKPANATGRRTDKMFSFLQVVSFPRNTCNTGGRNGTCYTSDECLQKGGVSSGSCANGFGVCCVFSIACGQTSSENQTFLVMGATTSPPNANCLYTICENNPNICRIRLDFTSFAITGPFAGTTSLGGAGNTPPTVNNGGSIGQCVTDSFTVTAPGNTGSPEICGTNTGQHMFVDTSSAACVNINFRFGGGSASRSYDIAVTQYSCRDEMAGPQDCLQYFTSNSGTVSSFNFALTAGAVPNTATHLANQFYSMCFRRNSGKCAICFTPTSSTASATIQQSFGLSVTATAITAAANDAKAVADSGCSSDYIVIPNANTLANLNMNAAGAVVTRGTDRFCGRYLNTALDATASQTLCTSMRPFKIIFRADGDEITTTVPPAGGITATMGSSNTDEQVGLPGGIIGFSFSYFQVGC